MSEEASKAIIFDTGSGYCKAGMASDDSPACCIPTLYTTGIGATGEISPLVGTSALKAAQRTELIRPVQYGGFKDLDALEHIWQHCYLNKLKLDSTEHPVLTNYYLDESKADKESAAMIFFETFSAPGYYCMNSSLLALYGSGRTSGLVVDSGEDLTSVVPIVEGYILPQAHAVSEFAGRSINHKLASLLANKYKVSDEVARTIKEKRGYSAIDYQEELVRYQKGFSKDIQYRLPDGSNLMIGSELIEASECIFNPSLAGSNEAGLVDLIKEVLQKIEPEQRNEMMNSIILCGGNTLHKNFTSRQNIVNHQNSKGSFIKQPDHE